VKHPEWSFQAKAVRYLEVALSDAAVWATDHARAASDAARMALAARGVKPGIPDVRVLTHGMSIDFECKATRRRPTPTQSDRAGELVANGGHWFCVRSLAEIKQALRGLGLTPAMSAMVFEVLHNLSCGRGRGRRDAPLRWKDVIPEPPDGRGSAAI
jgi:hypothetical protein